VFRVRTGGIARSHRIPPRRGRAAEDPIAGCPDTQSRNGSNRCARPAKTNRPIYGHTATALRKRSAGRGIRPAPVSSGICAAQPPEHGPRRQASRQQARHGEDNRPPPAKRSARTR